MKININDEIEITDEENIYQKLARATARAIDINLGKTTLADLLDGYTKSIILQQKIDKATEDLKGTLKINRHYIEETKYGKNEWICMDIDHIQELIDMLEEVKENE